MKWYNVVFYFVFNAYYKNGTYKNDIPWLTATGIVSVSTAIHLLNVVSIGSWLLNGKRLIVGDAFLPLGIVFVLINCIYFLGSKRYLKIYERYNHLSIKKGIKFASWFYIFSSFAIFAIIGLTIGMSK